MIKKDKWIVLIVSLCGFQFGYNVAIISGALLFISQTFSLSTLQASNAASIFLIGGLVGASLGGMIANYLGRKKGMQLASVIFAVGTFVAVFSGIFEWFLVGRIIQGLAAGSIAVIAPMYLAEIAPPEKRGAYVGTNQMTLVIGVLVAYGSSALFAESGNWQKMIGWGALPAIIQFISFFFLPEIGERKKEQLSSWKKLFDPLFRQALVASLLLSIFQQITGINVVIYFAPTIFESAGFSAAQTAIFATLGIGIINMLATIVAMKLIDKVGRRQILIGSLGGMTLSLLLIAWALQVKTDWTCVLAVFSLMAYVASFAVGMGPIPWLVMAEIYPRHLRAHGVSFAMFFNWVANYFVVFTFLDLAKKLTFSGAFSLYAALSFVALIFIWKKIPETKGKVLE